MPYKRTFGLPEPVADPPCLHLRSKAIYVTGNPDPIDVSETGSHRYSCWCNKTLRGIGPDDQTVERIACISGRDCFQPRM
jgi:hypothetical protein